MEDERVVCIRTTTCGCVLAATGIVACGGGSMGRRRERRNMQASGRVTLCQMEQRPREEMILEGERKREQRRAGAARRNDHWRAETNEREGCEQYPGASWKRRAAEGGGGGGGDGGDDEMAAGRGRVGLERWLVFVVGAAGGLRACFEHSASQRKAQYGRRRATLAYAGKEGRRGRSFNATTPPSSDGDWRPRLD